MGVQFKDAVKKEQEDIEMCQPTSTGKVQKPVAAKTLRAREKALSEKFDIVQQKVDTQLNKASGVVVDCFYHGDSPNAPLNKAYDYQMLLKLRGDNPFHLVKTVMLNGKYEGHAAIIIKQSMPFPFMKLSEEVRSMILRYALHTDSGDLVMTQKSSGTKAAYAKDYSAKHRLAVLETCKQMRQEALPILFEQRLIFPSTQTMASFLLQLGSNRVYIQNLRCENYNPQSARTCFHLLHDCKNLQYLSFKFVSSNEQPKTAVKNIFNDAQTFLLTVDKEDPTAGLKKLGFDKNAFHMRERNDDGTYNVLCWGPKEQVVFATGLKEKVLAAAKKL